MDLPNLVEKFRTLYTVLLDNYNFAEPPIEVIWTGECPIVIRAKRI